VRVDAHVHVWSHQHFSTVDVSSSIAAAGALEALVNTLLASGVTAAVVVQPSISGLDHDYLLAAVQTEHVRLVGLAQAQPENQRSLEVIDALTASGAVVGFRLPLIRADEKWFQTQAKAYWELAVSRRSVISVLATPTQLETIGRLAVAHPAVPVVVDHLGRFDLTDDRLRAIEELIRLAPLQNVYVKMSALGFLSHDEWPYRDLWPVLASVIDAFGAERVMWGSDYPFVLDHGSYEDSCSAAEEFLRTSGGIGEEEIMGTNALNVFFDRDTPPS
jgi:predicted TIM-barrel fold metal-dependent hydrolase